MTINFKECSEKLKKHLFLRTEPLGICLLESAKEKPKGFVEPYEDLGYHLATCQAFALSRRNKECFLMTKEDMWCFEPVVGFGFTSPPEEFLEGHNRYPGTASSIEAGSLWASNMPRLKLNNYEGILSAPLAYYENNPYPDVSIIYCDPAQLTQIMIAVNWIDGKDVLSRISGHAACVYAVVPAIKEGTFQVVVPCAGDRKRAAAQDNEMIFSFPINKIEELVKALEIIEKTDGGLPVKFTLKEEYSLEPHYKKMGKRIGMNIE